MSVLPDCKRFASRCVGRAGKPVDPDFTAWQVIGPIPGIDVARIVRLAAPFIG